MTTPTDRDVKIRLSFDDAALKTLERFKGGLREVDKEREHAQGGLAGFAKEAATFAVGGELQEMAVRVKEYAESYIEAAAAENEAIHAVAGLSAAVQGIPWETAAMHAEEYNKEVEMAAVQAGVAISDSQGAFQALLEYTDASAEGMAKAGHEMEHINTIAGVLGKSAEGVAREFGFMQEGILRTKGQLFQLLKQTGIFGTNLKEAGKHWAEMTDEQRAAKLSEGMEKIAGKMATAQPSFKQSVQSLKDMLEIRKEILGKALIDNLQPVIKDITESLKESTPQLEKFGKELSKDLAAGIREGVRLLKEGAAWIGDHYQQIHDSIVTAFDYAKGVFSFIIENWKLIAAGLAAAKVGGMAGGLPTAMFTGQGAAGLAGLAGQAAAATAALAALAVATYYVLEILKQYHEVKEAQKTNKGLVEDLAAQGYTKGVMSSIEKAKELDDTMGMSAEEFERWSSVIIAQSEQVRKETANFYEAMQDASAGADPTVELTEAYNAAVKAHNEAAANYGAQLLLQSGVTAKMIEDAGVSIEGGLQSFAERFAKASDDVKKKLGVFLGEGGGGAAMPKAGIHMSGGQTFNIKQEFRDQDPDRVAVVFRRDIMKAAERRIVASTATPFGT